MWLWDTSASVHNMVYSNSVSTCTRHLLKGQCHEMDIFLNVKSVLSMYDLMVFKFFQKLFTNIYNY